MGVKLTYVFALPNILAFCWKKFKGGGAKDNRPLFFQNNRLLFLLFFLLFFKNLRGGKSRFWGGAPLPPVAESQHKKAVIYQDLFQFIGCVRNVRIRSFFNVQRNNALFEFLFVMLNQKLDFIFFESFFFTIKIDVFSVLQVLIPTVVFFHESNY